MTSDARSESRASIERRSSPPETFCVGVVEDCGHVDRQRVKHLLQVIGAVLKVGSVGVQQDRPRRVPRQGGGKFDVC